MNMESVVGQNITIVFDALDLGTINRDVLRSIIEAPNSPTIVDSPGVLVAVFLLDAGMVVLQFGDRRLRITAPNAVDGVGTYPLWTYASSVGNLIPDSKSTPIAYGFNYDVKVVLDDIDPTTSLNSVFIRDIEAVETALDEGEIVSIVPRLRYQRDGLRHDLILEPSDDQSVKVHLNIHYTLDDESLPPESSMKDHFLRGFEYLEGTLERFFVI